MMRKMCYVIVLCALVSCKSNGKFSSTNDTELKVQTIALPQTGDVKTFQVRVFPEKKWTENGIKELGKKMQFNVDSCFYVVKDNVSYYPESIIPVANGMSTNFEYLLSFSNIPDGDSKAMELIYHDKYMSQKDYKLLLN